MGHICFTILGCGSSGGVPRLGASGKGPLWGKCDPENPKNHRRRCSLLIEKTALSGGVTRVLIDTTPDLRRQLLDAGVGELDGVVYTHSHADHIHGIDDLRQVGANIKRLLPIWADEATCKALSTRFEYVFKQPAGSSYPPILKMNSIEKEINISGAGGVITLIPFLCEHGHINALGFRIGNFAYLPDASSIPDDSWPLLEGLDMWVVDALQRNPHPSHSHLSNTLNWIERANPKRAVLTNMHIDMDFASLSNELPPHIRPAYDGMTITFAL